MYIDLAFEAARDNHTLFRLLKDVEQSLGPAVLRQFLLLAPGRGWCLVAAFNAWYLAEENSSATFNDFVFAVMEKNTPEIRSHVCIDGWCYDRR